MGKIFEEIDDYIASFIGRQPMFFVGTAPLALDGHVNVSPKGLDTFRILGPNTVAYLDLTGSGVETVAHVRENRRIVIMFCAFSGPPGILRLHGHGEVVEPGDEDFAALAGSFPPMLGTRAIIRVTVRRIAGSCGFGVPLMTLESERSQMGAWAERKGREGVLAYQADKNAVSIDGLRGLRLADAARQPERAALDESGALATESI